MFFPAAGQYGKINNIDPEEQIANPLLIWYMNPPKRIFYKDGRRYTNP